MTTSVDPAIEAGGQELEDEICRLTESLAETAPPRSRVAALGHSAARRVLDSWPLAIALLGTCGVLTAVNVLGGGLGGGYHPSAVSPAAQHAQLQTTARFAAVEARDFLARQHRLPSSPVEIGLSPADDISFVATGGGEVIAIARVDGFEARADSGNAGPQSGGQP